MAGLSGLADSGGSDHLVKRRDGTDINPAEQIMALHKCGDPDTGVNLPAMALDHNPEIHMYIVKAEDDAVGVFLEDWKYIDPGIFIGRIVQSVGLQAKRANNDIVNIQKAA